MRLCSDRREQEDTREKRGERRGDIKTCYSRIELKHKIASNKLTEEFQWSKIRLGEVENTQSNHRGYRRSTTEEVALSVFKDCTVFFIYPCICGAGTFIPSDCTVLSTPTNQMVLVIYIKLHKPLLNSMKYLHAFPILHGYLTSWTITSFWPCLDVTFTCCTYIVITLSVTQRRSTHRGVEG